MEERKRPASQEDGDSVAPPLKRQATAKEEKSRKRDDADLPGGADIERFRKEAIYRQMLEFKREKQTLESRLADAIRLANNRDDYIRKTDAFAEHLVEVCRIRKTHRASTTPYQPVPAELLINNDLEAFEKYMDARTEKLKAELEQIFSEEEASIPDKADMEAQLDKCRTLEKEAFMEMEKARQDRDQMIQRLETATQRYMVAERKLDRAKSSTVIKMEQQAMASSRAEANSNDGQQIEQTNGTSVDGEALARADEARAQAEAAATKRKEQMEEVIAENDKLKSQVTSLSSKQSSLTDDDFAASDLFKHLKTQTEEVIKRVNDLEATNIELRREAERLQAERTAYKNQIESEAQTSLNEKELYASKLEADLARVRSARDELHAKVQTYEANDTLERATVDQLNVLIHAKDERIQSLESEIERLNSETTAVSDSIEDLSDDALRLKYGTLEKQYEMLNQELQNLGVAYKKLQSATSTKINNQAELEERVKRAMADKNKADQRYFAAMKAKDTLGAEVRALRAQASKSSDLISGLREAEQSAKATMQSYEGQLAKANTSLDQLSKQNSRAQSEAATQSSASTMIKNQIGELKSQLDAKDLTLAEATSAKRKAEVEIEELKASIQERDKRLEAAKKTKGSSSDNETIEMLRSLAMCTVCRVSFKDTAIKTCGHTMCIGCVEERIQSRSRKCPHCNKAFGRDDYMKITLN